MDYLPRSHDLDLGNVAQLELGRSVRQIGINVKRVGRCWIRGHSCSDVVEDLLPLLLDLLLPLPKAGFHGAPVFRDSRTLAALGLLSFLPDFKTP